MALTFPLSLAAFYNILPIASVKWKPYRQDETSGLASGETIAAELAPPLWAARVMLSDMGHREAAGIAALIEALDGPMKVFEFSTGALEYPAFDPDGSLLGASVPEIGTIASGGTAFSLAGLPAGYRLTRGDFLSFDHGSSPVRRAFHRVLETVTADGAGETAEFAVFPALPAGAAAEIAVTLIKPAARVALVPNSYEEGTSRNAGVFGMAFEVRERY